MSIDCQKQFLIHNLLQMSQLKINILTSTVSLNQADKIDLED
jgi:hypothetical protein